MNLVKTKPILTLLLVFAASSATWAQTDADPGISNQQPAKGRFVQFKDLYLIPYTFRIPGTDIAIDMVPVPAGQFKLEFKNKAGKQVSMLVRVEPFWIAKTETTWQQYQSFMDLDIAFGKFESLKIRQVTKENKADAVSAPSLIYDKDYRMDSYGGSKSHPAATISQFGAKSYTKYLTKLTGVPYRLPSAVEWQYAAWGAKQPAKPVELDEGALDQVAWFKINARKRSLVARKKPNSLGIHDMLGNVAEWVLDGHQYDEKTFTPMITSSLNAVAWPTEHRNRRALGGSFLDHAENCQVHSSKFSTNDLWEEDPMLPTSPHWTCSDEGQGIGFRIVRPLNKVVSKDLARRYWEPDHPKITENLRVYESMNHVNTAIVDKDLPKALRKLPVRRKK